MRRLALFGSTGSIGRQTLEVVEWLSDFNVVLLAAGSNSELLLEQALRWKPEVVALADARGARWLADALFGTGVRLMVGDEAASNVASVVECDIALNAIVGVSGLSPSFKLIRRGIPLALANKESLVLAGDLINDVRRKSGAALIPVDSEHSALFQCLQGEDPVGIKRLILTASGGPFRDWTSEQAASATVEQALNHPTWKMGAKVTIDSATLMNKGLEVIEAYHLFGMPPTKIEVRIHPVSIVHSLVQFLDGSFKAQLGRPDMRLPIHYALTYPKRRLSEQLAADEPEDWSAVTFKRVEPGRFPCLDLAYRALEMGGTAPAVLNGADEAAVQRFLTGEIQFGDISKIIAGSLDAHQPRPADGIEPVLEADREGRYYALNFNPP